MPLILLVIIYLSGFLGHLLVLDILVLLGNGVR
jgi:hypothetical protein